MDTNSSVSQISTDITDGSMIDLSMWLRHQVFPGHCRCGVSASVAVAAALHQRTASGDDRGSLRKKEETGNDEKMGKKRRESIRNSESLEFNSSSWLMKRSPSCFFLPCLIEWCVLWFMCLSWFSTFGPRFSRSAWSPSLMVSRQGHIWFHWDGHGFAEKLSLL